MDALFEDRDVAPIEKQCGICGLELDENTHDLPGEGKVHTACLEQRVESGELSPGQAFALEKVASVHDLVVRHPDITENGCIVCNGKVAPDDLLISVAPNVSMCHCGCVSQFINSSTPAHVLITIARLNGMKWDSLIKSPLYCSHCKGSITTTPVTAGQDLYHMPCFAIRYASGELPSDLAETVITENKLSQSKLMQTAKAWGTLSQVAAMRREADGLVSNLWKRFTNWVSGLWEALSGANAAYDEAISTAESLTQEPVEAALNRHSISPAVQQAMDLLKELEEAEKAREAKVAEILRARNITNLKAAKTEAMAKISEYLNTLQSKQRKYADVLFRLHEVKHRATFQTEQFRTAVKALLAADAAMTAQIAALEARATKAGFTTNEVELLMTQPEVHPETEQLRQPGIPAPAPQQATTERQNPTTSALDEDQSIF